MRSLAGAQPTWADRPSMSARPFAREPGRAASKGPSQISDRPPGWHLGPHEVRSLARADIGWPPAAERPDAHDPKRTSVYLGVSFLMTSTATRMASSFPSFLCQCTVV